MKKIGLFVALCLCTALFACTAYAAAEDDSAFVTLRIAYPEGEELFETDYQKYSAIRARYVDDKTPIALSQYYDGCVYATVPSENADRLIEAFISDDAAFADEETDDNSFALYIMGELGKTGIIKGDGEGKANPYDKITRAEAAAMVVRLMGLDSGDDGNGGFDDVAPDAWYAAAVAAAVENNIVKGDTDNLFYPERSVSREEFEAMLARAFWKAGIQAEDANAAVEDIEAIFEGVSDADEISPWALSAYKLFEYFNIMDYDFSETSDEDGYSTGITLSPSKYALRCEAAELLYYAAETLQVYPSQTAIEYGFDKEMPVIDGSTSTYPFTEAVYSTLFGNGYRHPSRPAAHSKSHASYERLINGEVDMLFASVYPASDIIELAAEKGVELELIPIAYDAMVFFTNADNSAENITTEQITNIYVDNAYSNWNELGGPDALLYPYCRNYDSGSHAQMERHFLNGNQINEKIRTETTSGSMSNVLTDVMNAETTDPVGYGLGYSIYYYFNNMDLFYETKTYLKLLSIDGVAPTDETIADGSYPLSNNTYIVLRADTPEDSPARRMAEFMLTPLGQQCVEQAGYGPLKSE